MNYVVRVNLYGNSYASQAHRDLALFLDKQDALEYEAKIYEEIKSARHVSDFADVDALRIDASSPAKVYKTSPISYDERKAMEKKA